MRTVRAILFDLDGTLLDSAPDLVAALNWLRAGEGLEPLKTEAVSRFVSRGAVGILKAGMPATTDSQFAEWKALFLKRYAEVGYRDSQLYPGIRDVLDSLHRKQIPWGIVTNKITALTLPILESAGLFEQAAAIVCGDTLPQSKPDPAPVLLACNQLSIDARDTLFAGDDVRDIIAGNSAGTMTAAVMYGYGAFEFATADLKFSTTVEQPADFIELLD